MARLRGTIALQTQLGEIIDSTTAQQIQTQERLQDAYQRFTDGLSDELTDMIADWEFDLDGLRDVFKQFAKDMFIRPGLDALGGVVGNFFKGFGGGFAKGGHLMGGKWGIAGEDGPEPIFAGAGGLNIVNNDEAFGGGGRRGNTIFNITTPNADSFRYSQRQIARKAKATLGSD